MQKPNRNMFDFVDLHKKYDIQDLWKLTLKASHHECRIIQVEGKRRLLDCRKIWEMQ